MKGLERMRMCGGGVMVVVWSRSVCCICTVMLWDGQYGYLLETTRLRLEGHPMQGKN